MKILVTGSAGYIGSVVCELLIEQGHSVVGLDNFSNGHRQASIPGTMTYNANVNDEEQLDSIFTNHEPEAVIHLAAKSLVGESVTNPSKYYDANVVESLALLQKMTEYGVTKIVFSSSAAVYGEPEKTPITEKQAPNPINPYGETKRAFEEILKWYEHAYGLRYIALRYFNAAGATSLFGEHHTPETHLIPIILDVALQQDRPMKIFGDDYETPDGTCIRDYVHVIDIANAHIDALRSLEKKPSGIYNIGNGIGFSNREIYETAKQITGQNIPLQITPRRDGDPAILVASNDKAGNDLGWNAKHSELAEIIQSAWDWKKKFPHGYE